MAGVRIRPPLAPLGPRAKEHVCLLTPGPAPSQMEPRSTEPTEGMTDQFNPVPVRYGPPPSQWGAEDRGYVKSPRRPILRAC